MGEFGDAPIRIHPHIQRAAIAAERVVAHDMGVGRVQFSCAVGGGGEAE